MNMIYFLMAALAAIMFAACGVLWLRERGIHPIDDVMSRFRRLDPFSKVLVVVAFCISIVYGGTKPPTPPGPTVEKIKAIIDAVSSTSVTAHWEFTDVDVSSLHGKRVRVLVNNEKMNGWQTVFEGDAETDTSCSFDGFYIADDTKVQVKVDNAIMAVKLSIREGL